MHPSVSLRRACIAGGLLLSTAVGACEQEDPPGELCTQAGYAGPHGLALEFPDLDPAAVYTVEVATASASGTWTCEAGSCGSFSGNGEAHSPSFLHDGVIQFMTIGETDLVLPEEVSVTLTQGADQWSMSLTAVAGASCINGPGCDEWPWAWYALARDGDGLTVQRHLVPCDWWTDDCPDRQPSVELGPPEIVPGGPESMLACEVLE